MCFVAVLCCAVFYLALPYLTSPHLTLPSPTSFHVLPVLCVTDTLLLDSFLLESARSIPFSFHGLLRQHKGSIGSLLLALCCAWLRYLT